MSLDITISQQMLEWIHELDRYHHGDLEHCDAVEWLSNVKRLNQNIANELSQLVLKKLGRSPLD